MTKLFLLSCALLFSCNNQKFENHFFQGPRETRLQRMRQYSLLEQYKIYRFGHDTIEPPALELAAPIIEKGGAAIPFLTKQLESDKDDLAVRDILFLLRGMMWRQTYDVTKNPTLIQILDRRVQEIKNANVQYSSRTMLDNIKGNPERP
jgi:hypothetical protein